MSNKTEIRIAALRRTGQHGIINWIATQAIQSKLKNATGILLAENRNKQTASHNAKVTFLNDPHPDTNPFQTCSMCNVLDLPRHFLAPKDKPKLAAQRDWLIYNYEDRRLETIFTNHFERDHDRYIGSSERRIDVIILRDAYNSFASRHAAKWCFDHIGHDPNYALSIRLWKAYAHEFLGHTNFLRHNKTTINYNKWCRNRDYRAALAVSLGLNFTDSGFKSIVRSYGGGSSFDRARFHGLAHRMQVLERWKYFANDKRYRHIFKDQELVDLSTEIFGHIEGTEALLKPWPAVVVLKPITVPQRYRRIRHKI
jgi:hypothetical protein